MGIWVLVLAVVVFWLVGTGFLYKVYRAENLNTEEKLETLAAEVVSVKKDLLLSGKEQTAIQVELNTCKATQLEMKAEILTLQEKSVGRLPYATSDNLLDVQCELYAVVSRLSADQERTKQVLDNVAHVLAGVQSKPKERQDIRLEQIATQAVSQTTIDSIRRLMNVSGVTVGELME